jgi:hypothetical protein
MTVLGYKYITEQQAQQARKQCADYYGLPKSPDDVTQYWVDYQFAELNQPPFWYIIYDQSVLDILGEPELMEITTPDI